MIRLAIIGPDVNTMKPKSHGLRNANAAHVSRSPNPASQRRALMRGPGLTVMAVAIDAAAGSSYFVACLIAATASFCAWFSAAAGDCWPSRTRWTPFIQAALNSALAGDAGTPKENRCTSRTFLTASSKYRLIDV